LRWQKRLSSEIRRALAPMTGALTVAEQCRLEALLERMLAPRG
jgi:hypothetical protein